MGSGDSKLLHLASDDVLAVYVLWQLNKPHSDGILSSYIKGAPERVLAKCSTYLKDGACEAITDEFRTAYDDAYNVCFRA